MALLGKRCSYELRDTLSITYSQDAIVRAQIHSFKSNMLTIESYPPEARYLWFKFSLCRHGKRDGCY